MNKMFAIMLFVAMILIVAGCNGDGMNKEDVKAFVKEYKTAQYTIKNPDNSPSGLEITENVKQFVSEEELENLKKNRFFGIAPVIAKNINKSIELDEVKLMKLEENEDGSIDYRYTLKLKYYDDESSVTIDKEGELTIKNDDGLKITRDWEKPNEFEQNAILHSH